MIELLLLAILITLLGIWPVAIGILIFLVVIKLIYNIIKFTVDNWNNTEI